MPDSFALARDRMVEEQVVGRGVRDPRVIEAIRTVPRHEFVEPGLARRCYDSGSLPIGLEQTISQPFIVAYMTEQLQVEKGQRVLEVGTGSGYQAAVLSELGAEVFTIERHEDLQVRARRRLSRQGYMKVHYHVGDGGKGWPGGEKFDRVLVTAHAPEIPIPLIGQLVENGRIIAPLGDDKGQELVLGIMVRGQLRRRRLMPCGFVPLVAGR